MSLFSALSHPEIPNDCNDNKIQQVHTELFLHMQNALSGFYTKLNGGPWDSTLIMMGVPALKMGVPSYYMNI